MTTNTIVNFTDTATGWQRAFYAFLAEKEQRSGSRRTVEGYSRMLQDFFGRSGKQPDQCNFSGYFCLCSWSGTIRQTAIGHHNRCPYRLCQFLLSFSHSHGYRPVQPL